LAHTVALTTIFARIRTRANVRDVKFTNAILDDLVKQAILDVLDLILEVNPTYNQTSSDLNITSGTDYVATPDDFYRGYGVQVYDSDSLWKWLERFEWLDLEDTGQNQTTRTAIKYRFDGSTIKFNQPPGWTLASGLRCHYIPVPAVCTAAYGVAPVSWDAVHGWDDHVAWNVTAQVLEAKKMDPSFAASMMARAGQRIRRAARHRDMARVPRQRDGRSRAYSKHKLPMP
jgi:hypothetical protein